jgi:hypothetical protein
MPKQIDNEKKSGNDKLPMSTVKKAAIAVLAGAAVVGGVFATKKPSFEIPIVADSTTEYEAQGPEVEIEGLEIGDKVKYFPKSIVIDLGKGNLRGGPAVQKDKRNGEDNTVILEGVQDGKVTLQNPIEYDSVINGVSNPNGRLFKSTVDGVSIYVFVDAVAAVGGITDAETGEQISIDPTQIVEAPITSMREDGVIVQDPATNEPVTIAATYTKQS